MTWRQHSDASSFLSAHIDILLSPSDDYFIRRSLSEEEMFIDTEAANRGTKVPAINSPDNTGYSSQETTPLMTSFLGQAPPPSYLEATTPNLWNASRSGDEGARLLSFDGRASPAPPLADPLDGLYKGPTYRKRTLRELCSRARAMKWIAAILAIAVVAAIIAAVTHKNRATPIQPPTPAQPVQPGQSQLPSQSQKDYPIRWPSRCGKDYNVKTEEFDFGSPSSLHISEGIQNVRNGESYKLVSGWIHILPASSSQTPGTIRAKFSYAVSSSVDISSVRYTASTTGLTIGESSTPSLRRLRRERGTACLGMSILLYVAPGTKLSDLVVQASHLGMQVHDHVDLAITNSTSISLTSGTLDASALHSRETRLETIAGSISGKYALYDLLYVNTVSGSVNINVEPMPDAPNTHSPAVFQAQSLSGSLAVDFERRNIPDRDYQVAVDTKVGSISGTLIHGSRTTLQSVAGSINADILPFREGSYESVIETDSRSGETDVVVRGPYRDTGAVVLWSGSGKSPSVVETNSREISRSRKVSRREGGVLSGLKSTHKTISGAINLTYPQEWEGHIDGSALSGALHLQGKDLELLDEVSEPGKNHVEARKGAGGSELVFSTVSGGCEVKVGRV